MDNNHLNNKNPFELFPDIFAKKKKPNLERIKKTQQSDKNVPLNNVVNSNQSKSAIRPPEPPDVSWLRHDLAYATPTGANRFPQALIITNSKERLAFYGKVVKSFEMDIEHAHLETWAIRLLSSKQFSLILYESPLKFLEFEQQMRILSGHKRGSVLYVIIGKKLRTLYDLEALSLSANLVVNTKDIRHLYKILKKGFQDYEKLFRPFLNEIQANNKLSPP